MNGDYEAVAATWPLWAAIAVPAVYPGRAWRLTVASLSAAYIVILLFVPPAIGPVVGGTGNAWVLSECVVGLASAGYYFYQAQLRGNWLLRGLAVLITSAVAAYAVYGAGHFGLSWDTRLLNSLSAARIILFAAGVLIFIRGVLSWRQE